MAGAGGGEQVAGREGPVGPPGVGDGGDLLLGGEVAELIGGPDCRARAGQLRPTWLRKVALSQNRYSSTMRPSVHRAAVL